MHEFITDATTDKAHHVNAKDLHALTTTVFGIDLPEDSHGPWCIGPLAVPGDDGVLRAGARLYVAKAVTDLRG